MRHKKNTVKLGRSSAHRQALFGSLVSNFVEQQRIRTTVSKAKLAGRLAEKMVTLAKKGTLSARRQAIATMRNPDAVARLFTAIAPQFTERKGGYTRIVKMGRRSSDGSEMALLEWVGLAPIDRKRKPKTKEEGKSPSADADSKKS